MHVFQISKLISLFSCLALILFVHTSVVSANYNYEFAQENDYHDDDDDDDDNDDDDDDDNDDYDDDELLQYIRLSTLSLPTTVRLNEMITLSGYLVNDGPVTFDDEIELFWAIEDELPSNFNDLEEDGIEIEFETTILSQDSVAFSIEIPVTTQLFNPDSRDVALIWPTLYRHRDVALIWPTLYRETYVVNSIQTINAFTSTNETINGDMSNNQAASAGNNQTKFGHKDNKTAFKANKSFSDIQLWPTIADSEIRISAFTPISKIRIYNVKGQLIAQNESLMTNELSINSADWPSDLYFVKITLVNGQIQTKRVFIK